MSQTIRLNVVVTAEDDVDPEVVRGNIAAALDLYTHTGKPDRNQRAEGFITNARVDINDAPLNSEGPFSIYEKKPNGDYNNLPDEIRETWIGAMGTAEALEDSGTFVQIRDGNNKAVYTTSDGES